MKEIIIGNKVVLNVEEWINKTSGRGDFQLRIVDKNGIEKQVFKRSFLGFGLKPYIQVLNYQIIKLPSKFKARGIGYGNKTGEAGR
ncbi:MAG: hypothetical protein BACD_02286 [Bacteroides rodentium]